MPSQALALAAMASRRAVTAGMRRVLTFTAAAMFMAEGKLSFDDCDMFTWSFGCTGVLLPSAVPASWQHRFEITSLTFMLNWVPEPVIQTCSGNMSRCCPARISSQTLVIRPDTLSSRRLAVWFTVAADRFRIP